MIFGIDTLQLVASFMLGVIVGVALAGAALLHWGCAYHGCLMCDRNAR